MWKVILVLAFAFSLEGTGRMTAVQAAPLRQDSPEANYVLAVYLPDPPVCMGQRRIVRVRLVSNRNVFTPGRPNQNYEVKGLFNITVESSVQNESIGTLTPESLLTGWDVIQDGLPGEGFFTFTAKKAGKTNLVFETLVPASITGTVDKYLGPLRPIEVVNCKYKVTMIYRRSVQGFSVSGKLITSIEGDGKQYRGSGTMDAKSTVNAVCGTTVTSFLGPTDITGTIPDDEHLNLAFTYHPATTKTSIGGECGQVAFSKTQDPTSFLIPTATFPVRGGTRTFRAPQGGTITITVKPEKVGAGS